MLGFERTWLPYLYLYLVGGAIFFIGMYIILKSKSLNQDIEIHKKWFHVLIFGFFYYMGIHAFFIVAAVGSNLILISLGLVLSIMIFHLIINVLLVPKRKI
tara:strand:+ start:611 stop:913 length:303 start_codon:yes stop_codon:yes gene_type:complete